MDGRCTETKLRPRFGFRSHVETAVERNPANAIQYGIVGRNWCSVVVDGDDKLFAFRDRRFRCDNQIDSRSGRSGWPIIDRDLRDVHSLKVEVESSSLAVAVAVIRAVPDNEHEVVADS